MSKLVATKIAQIAQTVRPKNSEFNALVGIMGRVLVVRTLRLVLSLVQKSRN
jgi:hypothetical protein